MEILIMGAMLSFNILIIYYKVTHDRIPDGLLDASLLILLGFVFGGSTASLQIATVASAVISLYLLAFPPTTNTTSTQEISYE